MNKRRVCLLLAVGLALVACSHSSSSGAGSETRPRRERQEALQELGPAGQQELRDIVSTGKLEGMQWPNFADHIASVKEFYEETGYKLAWSQNGKPTPQALELIRILKEAESKGLDSKDYDGPRWPDRLKTLQSDSGPRESPRIRFDVALTVSGARYISDLHLGKVDPENLHKDFDVERQHHDSGAFLRTKVVDAQNVQDALTQVECPYPGYKRDLIALQKYLQMEKQEAPDPLPQVQKPIAPGQTYEGAGKLVRRLQFLGELPASMTVPTDSQIYSKEIAEGVKLFQTRHGLEADGKLGPGTIAEINQPISHRVQQLRLSLERWRWLPHDYPEAPIVVNIPEFKLRAGDLPEKPTFITSVVVGKAMTGNTFSTV